MRKGRTISKSLSLSICIAFAAGLLSACGGLSQDTSRGVSGSAISGSAVSGSAVVSDNNTSFIDEKYPDFVGDVVTVLCTENYGYECTNDGKGELLQVRLTDSRQTEIPWDKPEDVEYIMDVLAVKNGYLYCLTGSKKENVSIYQIPIKEDSGGNETLLTEQAKRLINSKGDNCFLDLETVYIGERYVICPKEDGDGKLLKLDLKTGEKTTFPGPKEDWFYDATDQFINCGDYLVIKLDSEDIYVAHVEKGKWTKICSDCMCEEDIEIGADAWNPEGYYYTGEAEEFWSDIIPAVEVYRYDFQKQKNSLWISEKQIQETVKQVKRQEFDPDALDVCAVMGLYTQSDRVYVEVQSNWKKSGEYYVTYQVFSRGIEEDELRYEKDLTECMKQHGTIRRGSFVAEEYSVFEGTRQDHVVMEGTKLYAMIDGKAYMVCYDGEEKTERRAEYTLATGEFRWITSEDMDAWKWHSFYYEPYDLFYSELDEPNDTIARWGSRVEESRAPRIMGVGDDFTFEEE